MSYAIRYNNPIVQRRLVRSYTAGALCAAGHRRFEILRREIPKLDRLTREWEQHLQPLADAVPDVQPRQQVWAAIDAHIGNSVAPERKGFWRSLGIPHALAFVSTAAAIVLALMTVMSTPTQAPSIDYIAVLSNSGGEPQLVATASEELMSLDLRLLGDEAPADTVYQLWAVSKTDGETRSIGLLESGKLSKRSLDQNSWRLITDAQELLLTAEMRGGSAIGEPSDDVISRGLCIRLREG